MSLWSQTLFDQISFIARLAQPATGAHNLPPSCSPLRATPSSMWATLCQSSSIVTVGHCAFLFIEFWCCVRDLMTFAIFLRSQMAQLAQCKLFPNSLPASPDAVHCMQVPSIAPQTDSLLLHPPLFAKFSAIAADTVLCPSRELSPKKVTWHTSTPL